MSASESVAGTYAASKPRAAVQRIVTRTWFQRAIIGLILVNAVILGLDTYPSIMSEHGDALHLVNNLIVAIFVVEIVLRLYADGWAFFKSGWNIFDFIVVAASLVPASTSSAVLRLLRLMRVFRLLSAVRSMRLVVNALVGSIPGILSMGALFVMVLYVFAIASTTLLGQYDAQQFGDLGRTFTSLYRVVMGDGWGDVVVPIARQHPWVWAYFIGFSFIGAIILLNLFIAVVVESMNRLQTQEIEEAHGQDEDVSQQILDEVRQLRAEVGRLQRGGDQTS